MFYQVLAERKKEKRGSLRWISLASDDYSRIHYAVQETFLYHDAVSVLFITRFMLIKEVLKTSFGHVNFVMKEEKICI